VIVVPAPPASLAGKDSKKRREARAQLVSVLFDARGKRKLPDDHELAAAMAACGAVDSWWVCEANSHGPLYFLPTRQWLSALCAFVDTHKVRRVLEVGAGDGFLSFCLQRRRPNLSVLATDDFSWTLAANRQNPDDVAEFKGVAFAGIQPLPHVQKQGAVAAVKAFKPDLVIVSWAPPGTLVERVIRAPSKLVLDISVDGDVCGNGARTWRFEKEFLDGPLEAKGLCRLDATPLGPPGTRATRCTLYFGARHRRFGVDKAGGLVFA